LGNIYFNEALWRARGHPLRADNTLLSAKVERLHGAIRAVQREAIDEGGTTLSDGAYQ
jgi:formamidopyrimidine-DNA glycosylase